MRKSFRRTHKNCRKSASASRMIDFVFLDIYERKCAGGAPKRGSSWVFSTFWTNFRYSTLKYFRPFRSKNGLVRVQNAFEAWKNDRGSYPLDFGREGGSTNSWSPPFDEDNAFLESKRRLKTFPVRSSCLQLGIKQRWINFFRSRFFSDVARDLLLLWKSKAIEAHSAFVSNSAWSSYVE